jgi:hypothetical protein
MRAGAGAALERQERRRERPAFECPLAAGDGSGLAEDRS